MAHWFMTGTQQTPPPRWKVAVVSWLGIFPTVLLLFTLLACDTLIHYRIRWKAARCA